MIGARLFRSREGAAAVEMALILPLLLLILIGSVETGRYFWSQHILIKGVRDGAVYAARQRIDNFDCDGSTVSSDVVTNTSNLVKTGTLAGGTNQLGNWDDEDATLALELDCVTEANGTPLSGIYTANDGNIPVLTVRAQLPFTSLFGFRSGLKLNATQQAAVYGA